MKAEAEIEGGWPTWWYVCSECHVQIDYKKTPCPHCGAEVSWDGVLLKDSRKIYRGEETEPSE
jgi:rRNA maturation endonuclease Nob1